ncbi:MAG: N-formylglutamate deformylase [Alphaproteobacteria bacterium]
MSDDVTSEYVTIVEGTSPVILAQPHCGIGLVPGLAARLTSGAQALGDTDWHIDRLYDGLAADATIVRANLSRYVIDLNRDPSGVSLYPGQNTTGLCPLSGFDGKPLYLPGQAPGKAEIAERTRLYHAPYHGALSAQIDRVRAVHGIAVLYDCHSINSALPFLFEGQLPVFNLGTFDGRSCAPALARAAASVLGSAEIDGFDWVVNGRFKGGWTTRHYGDPQAGVHGVQMELAWRGYMEETAPWKYQNDWASKLRPHLARLLGALEAVALQPSEPTGDQP